MSRRPSRLLTLLAAALACVTFVPAQPAISAPTDTVYVTKSGERYHLKHCRTIKKSTTVTETTREKAERDGKTACKVCKP